MHDSVALGTDKSSYLTASHCVKQGRAVYCIDLKSHESRSTALEVPYHQVHTELVAAAPSMMQRTRESLQHNSSPLHHGAAFCCCQRVSPVDDTLIARPRLVRLPQLDADAALEASALRRQVLEYAPAHELGGRVLAWQVEDGQKRWFVRGCAHVAQSEVQHGTWRMIA